MFCTKIKQTTVGDPGKTNSWNRKVGFMGSACNSLLNGSTDTFLAA
jgi:hypothetical protein